jgi:hypothetical protein
LLQKEITTVVIVYGDQKKRKENTNIARSFADFNLGFAAVGLIFSLASAPIFFDCKQLSE